VPQVFNFKRMLIISQQLVKLQAILFIILYPEVFPVPVQCHTVTKNLVQDGGIHAATTGLSKCNSKINKYGTGVLATACDSMTDDTSDCLNINSVYRCDVFLINIP